MHGCTAEGPAACKLWYGLLGVVPSCDLYDQLILVRTIEWKGDDLPSVGVGVGVPTKSASSSILDGVFLSDIYPSESIRGFTISKNL